MIELDGWGHATRRKEDQARDQWLNEQGFKVLRFLDNEVLTNTDSVLEAIGEACLHYLGSERE